MIDCVIYTPEATNDLQQAYRWYEERAPGLGDQFLQCVEAVVQTIRQHPELYPLAAGEFRHAPIRRFPYEVIYEPDAGGLTVYAVFHCSQNPQRWRSRLGPGA